MATTYRNLLLLVSFAMAMCDVEFKYTLENAQEAIEEYQITEKEGFLYRLSCELVNPQYTVVLDKHDEHEFGITLSAADSIKLNMDDRVRTDYPYAYIPIALDKRPGIKLQPKKVQASGCIFGQGYEVFYLSKMQIEVVGDQHSKKYFKLWVTFANSKDKHFVKLKVPLFAKSGQIMNFPALTEFNPIIRQLQLYSSFGGNNNYALVTGVWWMDCVLNTAVYQSTEKKDNTHTDIYIGLPLRVELDDIKKLLNLG